MDSSIGFVPKSFSKRLSRHSYISTIDEVEKSASRISLNEKTENVIEKKEDDGSNWCCSYCQESNLDCLVKCHTCQMIFCNSGLKDSSHLFLHSKFLNHYSFELLNYYQNDNYSEQYQEYLDHKDDDVPLPKPEKLVPSQIKCAHCDNSDIFDLSFILVNDLTKELTNLKTDYSEIDKLENINKKVIFFCSKDTLTTTTGIGLPKKKCFEELQNNLFDGLDIEDDFIRPIFNNFDVGNKFGFKKFFINRLLLKDNSNLNPKILLNQINLSNIYTVETKRLRELKKQNLKKNDFYNLIDETNDYQFFDSEDEEDLFNEKPEEESKTGTTFITSPLLLEENRLFQTKTTGLKKITKTYLSKMSSYEDFYSFATHNLNLMFKEQFAMLSLSSTTHKLTNNIVFVPYKRITIENNGEVIIRLNTNYNLPMLKIHQILGLKYADNGRIAFGMIMEIPNNSFNPEIKLKLLSHKNVNRETFASENVFIDNLEEFFSRKIESPRDFKLEKVITSYKSFEIIPFDLVFSRIIDVIFQILQKKIQIEEFLLNVILGKNFENFEFNLSSFRNTNVYGPNFNLSQKRAIDNLDSNKVVLIKGEVGTGKSLVSSAIIKNLIDKQLSPILVCSGTNSTVDNLCDQFYNDYVIKNPDDNILISRLIAPLKENQYNINHKIGDLCFHNFILANAPEELIDLFLKYKVHGENCLSPKNILRLNKFYQDFFQQQDVIFTTCYNAFDPKLKDVKFKSIIIDDCSTTMNLLTLPPLARNCEKLVLMGDDKQLSPYIHDMKDCKILKQSLFQRILYNKLVKPIILTEQYRMTNKLAEFPNNFFYNNELTNGSVKEKRVSSANFTHSRKGSNGARNSFQFSGLSRSSSLNSISEFNKKNKSYGGIGRSSFIKKFNWPNPKVPIVFWDHDNVIDYRENFIKYHKKINNIENFYINQITYQNYNEALQTISLIKNLHDESGVDYKDIGIITFYAGQRVLLAQLIQEEFSSAMSRRNSRRISIGNNNNNNNHNGHKRTSSMGNGQYKSFNNNNRMSFNGQGLNRDISHQIQRLSATSNEFLFENHDPTETEMSIIDKVKNIEIGSVSAFQGKEKEFIIINLVKTELLDPKNLEELKIIDDYRKLNVAITRAKKGLIILGNSKVLSTASKDWANYLSYLYEQGCVVEGANQNDWHETYHEHMTYLRR